MKYKFNVTFDKRFEYFEPEDGNHNLAFLDQSRKSIKVQISLGCHLTLLDLLQQLSAVGTKVLSEDLQEVARRFKLEDGSEMTDIRLINEDGVDCTFSIDTFCEVEEEIDVLERLQNALTPDSLYRR